MDFKLNRPCAHCPFRKDIPAYLTKPRVAEIRDSLDRGTFPCHKTIDYDAIDEDSDYQQVQQGTQHCAGALILLDKEDRFGNMHRVAGRLGIFDPDRLCDHEVVFDSFDEMIEAQPDRGSRGEGGGC